MKSVDSEGRMLLENYERVVNRRGAAEREVQQAKINSHLAKRGVGLPLYYELAGTIKGKVDGYLDQGLGGVKIQTLLLDDPMFGQFMEEHRRKENAGYASMPWADVFGEAGANLPEDTARVVGGIFDPRTWAGMGQMVGQTMDLATRLKMGQTGWGQGEPGSFVPLMTQEQARGQTPTSLNEWPALSGLLGSIKDYADEGGRKKKVALNPAETGSDILAAGSLALKPLSATLQLTKMPKAASIVGQIGTGMDVLDPSSWSTRVIRGVGGWLMPKKGQKNSASMLRTEKRLMERELLTEHAPTSTLTSDPKAIRHDNFLFEKKNTKLARSVMAVLDMPKILEEKLGNVTVATASAKLVDGFRKFEDNFYRVQEDLWWNLGQSVEVLAKDARKWKHDPEFTVLQQEGGAKATSVGIGLREAGVLEPYTRLKAQPGYEALAAIEGTFSHAQEVFRDLRKGESQLKPSKWIKDVERLMVLASGDSAVHGPLATNLGQIKELRSRVFHALEVRPGSEIGIHPRTRSFLKRMYMALTDDMNQAATRFSEEADHPLWGRVGHHFAVDFKKIRASYAEGKAVVDSKMGLAIKRAVENGDDLKDFVYQYAFRGDKGKDGGPLLTSEIEPWYQAMNKIDPTIASDFRSATAIRLIDESRGEGGILNAKKLGDKIADLGHGRDRSQGEIRLGRLLGEDIAEDILGIEEVFNEMETSGIPMGTVKSHRGMPPDLGIMERFKGLSLDNLARLIFGGAPGAVGLLAGAAAGGASGGWTSGAKTAMLGRSAVALMVLGTDAYKGLVDTRKRYVTGGGFAPLAEVIGFIEKADLPTRVALKGGRRSYISQQETEEEAASSAAIQPASEVWQRQQEALDAIIRGQLQQ